MEINEKEYQEYLISTVREVHSKRVQSRLLKGLEEEKLVRLRKTSMHPSDESIIDLSEVEESERLPEAIASGNLSIQRYIEKDEFLSSYKQTALFRVHTSNHDRIFDELQQKGVIQDFSNYLFDDIIFEDTDYNFRPTKYTVGNVIMLKFSRLLTAFTPETGDRKQMKYPVLCVYFKHLQVIEIRLNKVKNYFKEDDFFYHKQIEFVLNWLHKHAGFETEDIDISSIIGCISKQGQAEIAVHSQAMSLANGGKLDKNYVLPLLGELKELIKSNEELFTESPEIRKLFDQFISETEEAAELPWMSLVWEGKGTRITFKHNHMNQGYTLWQHCGSLSDMEKMNDLTQYIINYKSGHAQYTVK